MPNAGAHSIAGSEDGHGGNIEGGALGKLEATLGRQARQGGVAERSLSRAPQRRNLCAHRLVFWAEQGLAFDVGGSSVGAGVRTTSMCGVSIRSAMRAPGSSLAATQSRLDVRAETSAIVGLPSTWQ